jgi:hypothetical protein
MGFNSAFKELIANERCTKILSQLFNNYTGINGSLFHRQLLQTGDSFAPLSNNSIQPVGIHSPRKQRNIDLLTPHKIISA